MRISEVRKLLETYSSRQLQLIIGEMYKAIPKAIKEDRDIDGILMNPDAPAASKKRLKTVQVPNIEALRDETEQFIDYAYNQYYFVSNSVVPKRERPKWRFVAKRLYKSLLAAATFEVNLPHASTLLERLYELLCYSCSYTLFTAYDSFQSVGIEQTTFFQTVLSLKHACEPLSEFITHAISLIIENSVNRYTLPTTLMQIALEFLHTSDALALAIQVCDTKIVQENLTPKKVREERLTEIYSKKETVNQLVEMAFLCYRDLGEFDRGIQYFTKHYWEENPEVKLYVLLRWLYNCQQPEHFVQEYHKAIHAGVQPRKQLVNVFEIIQTTGVFPENFY